LRGCSCALYRYLTANYLCIVGGPPPPPPPKTECFGKCGLYFEAFWYPKKPSGQTLKDWERSVHQERWHGWTPLVSHPALANNLWYASDNAFVRDIPGFRAQNFYVMRWRGWFGVSRQGKYKFQTTSRDGSRLYLARKMVVDNDGLNGARQRSGFAVLRRGWTPITVTFFARGKAMLKVAVQFPGMARA